MIIDEGSVPAMQILSILLFNLRFQMVYILVEVSFYIATYI